MCPPPPLVFGAQKKPGLDRVKNKPKVLVCPNLRAYEPLHEHRWTLLCLTSNGKMLAPLGAEEHTHLAAQLAALSRSPLRLTQLETSDLSVAWRVASSAKNEAWFWINSERSLIKIRKSTGPRTVSWGITDSGVWKVDVMLCKRTHFCLCCRKLAHHSREGLSNSINESLIAQQPRDSVKRLAPIQKHRFDIGSLIESHVPMVS